MNPYLVLMRQMLISERSKVFKWVIGLILALLGVPVLIGVTLSGKLAWEAVTSLALVIPLAIVLVGWWVSYPQRALALNTPINAHLVPGLRSYLLKLSIGLWLATTTLQAAIVAVGFGHFVETWLLAAVVPIYIAICVRSPWGVMVYLLAWLLSSQGLLPKAMLQLMLGSAWGSLVLVLSVALLGSLVWAWVLAAGGDSHWRLQSRQRQLARLMKGNLQPGLNGYHRLQAMANPLSYHHLLRRALLRDSSPEQLLRYGLGPHAHWATFYTQIALITPLVVAGLLARKLGLLGAFFSEDLFRIMLVPAAIAILFAPWTLWLAVYQSRKEQVVLQLLPGVPQGRALNRLLAVLHLRYLGMIWLVFAVFALLLLLLPGFAGSFLVRAVGVVAAFAVLTASLILGDYAHLRAPSQHTYVWLMAAAGLFFAIWAVVDQMLVPVPVTLVWLVCTLLSAFWVRQRWQKMLAAPNAFPAGRLASTPA